MEDNANALYKGNVLLELSNNYTEQNGGAIFYANSKGTFQENSTLIFINNTAKGDGGAAWFGSNSCITLMTV